MKIYLTIIFSFFLAQVNAQVEDHFDDGDFTIAPVWSGNNSEFYVNPAGQLQLNAVQAGFSYLSVPANLTSLDSIEWRFFIKLGFSPSTSNYSKVYLSSDQYDLQQSLNGYFLRFGESLSNDAIELFRQNGTSITSVCRGLDGNIAGSFNVGVRVFRSSTGNWTISTDYSGGENYQLEATGSDTFFNVAAYIGVCCDYTIGNISNFYFDDFYVGQFIRDTIPPSITGINVESDSVLSVFFSEPIEATSLGNLANYTVDNTVGNPSLLEQDSLNPLVYRITFHSHFLEGINYRFTVSGLKDIAMNPMLTQDFAFNYYPISIGKSNDVVFSEIYFEPASASPLPYAEYIELYNRSDSSVNLRNWKITDGSSDGSLSDFRLDAHHFVVLYDADDSLLFASIANSIPVDGLPSLNNDSGDELKLINPNNELISQISFSDKSYNDENKNDGGWSIERVDENFICVNIKNWKASVSTLHGTPGIENSVSAVFSDTQAPFVTNAFLSDSSTIQVNFSEPVSATALDVNNYRVDGDAGNFIQPVSISASPEYDTVVLHFSLSFSAGIYSLQINNSLTDCPGNPIDITQQIRLGFSEKAAKGDVIVNEILFNPFEGGNDFLEIYNHSNKIIDIKNWTIAESDDQDFSIVREDGKITDGNRILFPGSYLVLTEDKENIKKFYTCKDEYAFININSMPDFNSDNGRAIIFDDSGDLIDSMTFNEEMHFPLIADPKGVSLERIDEKQTINNFNWHSTAATAGFATPGYRNSQSLVLMLVGGEVNVGEEVFSPDNDGYNDFLSIHYSYPQSGTVLSLNVYDFNGKHVRKLLEGATTSSEGFVTWDGLNDEFTISPSGIYIVLANSFDLSGNNRTFKKAVFLTRKF